MARSYSWRGMTAGTIPNNSLIRYYGRWGTIATNGDVAFGTEFRISITNFPPVFAGTLAENKIQGHYDPVYPPEGVNLQWHYPEWYDEPVATPDNYAGHVGEYNGAWAEATIRVSYLDGLSA